MDKINFIKEAFTCAIPFLFFSFPSDAIKFYGFQDVSLTFTFSVTLHVKIYDDMIILWNIF